MAMFLIQMLFASVIIHIKYINIYKNIENIALYIKKKLNIFGF